MANLLLSTLLSGIFSIITIIPVKDISFTDKYDESKATIIPAAFTTESGEILGKYRINNIEYGNKWVKEYTSIHPTKGLIVDFEKWHAPNGFQQYVLVKNNKARKFKDPKKRFRRALCNKSEDPSGPHYVQDKAEADFNRNKWKRCESVGKTKRYRFTTPLGSSIAILLHPYEYNVLTVNTKCNPQKQ